VTVQSAFPRFAALPFTAFGLAACIVNPPGWPERQPDPYVLHATTGKPFGRYPSSWDLPGARRIELDPDETGLRAAYADAPGRSLRCDEKVQNPGYPRARLVCWSEWDAGASVRFWLAPGEDCPWDMFSQIETNTRRACWSGSATLGGRTLTFQRAHQNGTNYPMDRATWLDEDQQLFMAADFVGLLEIELYPRAGSAQPPDGALALLTTSIAYWDKTLPFKH
jgi:hypothetical protein